MHKSTMTVRSDALNQSFDDVKIPLTDTEYRLQHLLDNEGFIKKTHYTHNAMHAGEIEELDQLTLINDTEWQKALDAVRESVKMLKSFLDSDLLVKMSANKHAPLLDVYEYANCVVDGAQADYIERAIGEQYGVVVLNKIKAVRASKEMAVD